MYIWRLSEEWLIRGRDYRRDNFNMVIINYGYRTRGRGTGFEVKLSAIVNRGTALSRGTQTSAHEARDLLDPRARLTESLIDAQMLFIIAKGPPPIDDVTLNFHRLEPALFQRFYLSLHGRFDYLFLLANGANLWYSLRAWILETRGLFISCTLFSYTASRVSLVFTLQLDTRLNSCLRL